MTGTALLHARPPVAMLLIAASWCIGGCADHVFVGENGLVSFAMTADTPPFVEVEEEALYIVESRIELPLRTPSETQFADLFSESDDLPWERRPWVSRGDYEIEVDWAIISLEEEPVSITLTLNGFNEFTEYMPGFAIDDDEVIPEFSQYERTIVMEPQERLFGTIREEQIDEIAVDLATVINGVANANAIVHPDSQSSIDPRATPFVPPTVAALVGLRAGLRAMGSIEGGAPNIVVELTVRVRDENDKIVDVEDAWEAPMPVIFEPSSLIVEEE